MQDADRLCAPLSPSPTEDGATHALRVARGVQAALWATLLLVSHKIWPTGQSGVFWGGLVMAGNLWAMNASATRLARLNRASPASPRHVTRFLALAFVGKFAAMLAATAAIIEYAKPDPLGFFAGFATLLAGILCAAPFGATRTKG